MFGGGKREDDEGEGKRKRSAREAEAGSATPKGDGGAFQRAEPREGSRAEGVDLRARTSGQRDFTLSHPPAPQINGLQPF